MKNMLFWHTFKSKFKMAVIKTVVVTYKKQFFSNIILFCWIHSSVDNPLTIPNDRVS